MAFLDKNGLQTLTNKIIQGDAIKVASHRGHTVANVIDNIQRECDNISTPNTMKIENNISNFKVGQGADLDVSGDAEEGKVEVELKGKTYQNLCPKHFIDYTSKSDYDGYKVIERGNYLIKPNTQYTIIVNVESFKHLERKGAYLLNNANSSTCIFNTKLWVGSEGIKRYLVTSQSDLTNKTVLLRCQNQDSRAIIKITDFTILEGDHTKTPVEELPQYFEGIKSSFEDGVVDVEVEGKNLFDESKHLFNVSIGSDSGVRWGTGKGGNRYSIKIPCEPNTTYSFSRVGGDRFGVWTHDEDFDGNTEVELHYKISSNDLKESFVIKTNSTAKVICIYVSLNEKAKNIQIEKLGSPTKYESYYKKKISFNIGEPLRSLPNGICDEIRNNNGQWELIRRVGYYKPKADDYARVHIPTNHPERIAIQLRQVEENCNYRYGGEDMLCSHLPSIERGFDADSDNISQHLSNKATYINLSASKWGYNESNGKTILTNFLSQNPSFIYYYELKVPTVTPIEPIEFDVKPLASVNINSHIVPPSTHSVELNRASQIERGIVEIAKLKERVDALEVAYDSHFIETQHKLSLLGLEYEIEGGNY